MLITVPIIGHVATIKKKSQIFLKEKDKCFVCFFLKRMVKKKQKGGYYKGEKRQRGGIYKGNKRQRGGNITEAAGKKLLNEIAKARGFFTNMVKKGSSNVNKKIQSGGIVSPRGSYWLNRLGNVDKLIMY